MEKHTTLTVAAHAIHALPLGETDRRSMMSWSQSPTEPSIASVEGSSVRTSPACANFALIRSVPFW